MKNIFCFKQECKKIILNNEKIHNRINNISNKTFEEKKLFLESLNFCLYNYFCFNYDNNPDDICKFNISIINLDFLNNNNDNFKKICDNICENYHKYYIENIISNMCICQKAKLFINNNLDKQISLDDIASKLHINRTYFCRLFKKQTGLCFVNYVNLCKIKKSKELLRNTSLNVENISEKCGFSSLTYFNKVFKNNTSISPSVYRKNNLLNKKD